MIKALLNQAGINFEENYPLAKHSSFKIGGEAELAIFPEDEQTLVDALCILKENKVRTEIIGNASNVLFGDGVLNGAFVFTSKISVYSFDGERLSASCGASLTGMAKKAADRGLSGLEFAYGIPGSIGGAVYMNAGAYGSCVSEVLLSSRVLDVNTGKIFELNLSEHNFDYRKSVFMEREGLVCLGANFGLRIGEKESIYAKMNEFMTSRKEKQPLEYANAGSYFKRPEGHFAGKLIEDCGLKGFSIGGAAVSPKHAGFIINLGGATASDVIALEGEIKRRVFECFGVTLEREVRIISNDYNDSNERK